MRILFGPAHDGPHIAPDEPGAYEWWYFDALSDDGRFALVAIWFHGSPMSPYYKAVVDGRVPLPRDWCGVFFSLHEKVGGRWRERAYAYNLYRGGTFVGDGATSLEVSVGGSTVSLAPSPCPSPSSSLRDGGGGTASGRSTASPVAPPASSSPPPSRSDEEGEGQGEGAHPLAYHLTLDEPGLWLGRTRAELTFSLPEGGAPLDLPPMGDKGESPEHSWVCVAPVCRVSGTLTLANGRRVEFTGDGYHDHNFGRLPWRDVDIWYWGRGTVHAGEEKRTVVCYRLLGVRGEQNHLLVLGEDGSVLLNSDAVGAGSGATGEEYRNPYGFRFLDEQEFRESATRTLAVLRYDLDDLRNPSMQTGPFYERFVADMFLIVGDEGTPDLDMDGKGVGEVFRPARLCGPIASRAMWTRIRRRS